LLIATTSDTPAALACWIASSVCGMTPSSAATTMTAMSVTCAPPARVLVNASGPGVSGKAIGLALCSWRAARADGVVPLGAVAEELHQQLARAHAEPLGKGAHRDRHFEGDLAFRLDRRRLVFLLFAELAEAAAGLVVALDDDVAADLDGLGAGRLAFLGTF